MSLKVFDLQCGSGHVFEGWFSSHDDYDRQMDRGLLTCPVCDDHHIVKLLSAPHLNVSHIRRSIEGGREASHREGKSDCGDSTRSPNRENGASHTTPTTEAAQVAKLQAALLRHVRQVINNAENVGPRFAEEARRLHDEGHSKAIRGTATASERAALAEDGIEVMAVPDLFDDERLQ